MYRVTLLPPNMLNVFTLYFLFCFKSAVSLWRLKNFKQTNKQTNWYKRCVMHFKYVSSVSVFEHFYFALLFKVK